MYVQTLIEIRTSRGHSGGIKHENQELLADVWHSCSNLALHKPVGYPEEHCISHISTGFIIFLGSKKQARSIIRQVAHLDWGSSHTEFDVPKETFSAFIEAIATVRTGEESLVRKSDMEAFYISRTAYIKSMLKVLGSINEGLYRETK